MTGQSAVAAPAIQALLPRVIGHRGAAATAPENTLESIREAKRLGAGGVEFDAKLAADGVPLLMHDDTLERTTSGKGRPSSQRLAAGEKCLIADINTLMPTSVRISRKELVIE